MNVKERLFSIHLAESVRRQTQYANRIGISASISKRNSVVTTNIHLQKPISKNKEI